MSLDLLVHLMRPTHVVCRYQRHSKRQHQEVCLHGQVRESCALVSVCCVSVDTHVNIMVIFTPNSPSPSPSIPTPPPSCPHPPLPHPLPSPSPSCPHPPLPLLPLRLPVLTLPYPTPSRPLLLPVLTLPSHSYPFSFLSSPSPTPSSPLLALTLYPTLSTPPDASK